MFDRIESLIGPENLKLIKSKTILLVGIGGVGGSALETLVRSGVQNLIIVDFDKIDISNLNRQTITNTYNVGCKKVEEAAKFCKKINPDCNVIIYDIFLEKDGICEILSNNKIDYVIDSCDSIKTKQSLIMECTNRNIKIISCMGTGNKIDPTKLEITNIMKTNNDPLARIMRKWAKDNNLDTKLVVVSSREVPLKKDKVISTMSFVPNVAGILLANYVIKDIIKI